MLDLITKGISKLFKSKSSKDMELVRPYVALVNQEFAKLRNISDDELRGKTQEMMQAIDAHLKSIDDKLAELHHQIANDDSLDIDAKDQRFQEIDRLEKERNKELEKKLLDILPLAFGVVKETARRLTENKQLVVSRTELDDRAHQRGRTNVTLDGEKAVWSNRWMAAGSEVVWEMVHYDVQIIGGVVLHQGKIAEMATGEGKTLVATFPAYLNALGRRGVHIVTVNDYLARRDSEWMGPLMEFHGLTVDCIDKYSPNSPQRLAAYQANITYGTNNEFGFDYLRDNMARTKAEQVQLRHHFAMIDEVDSVLVDDARTPLIISGPMEKADDQELFLQLKPRVLKLVQEQEKLVRDLLNESKKKVKDNADDAGLPLFRAYRGLPKSKPLIKFLSEQGMKQMMQKTENYYLQDNGRLMHEADEPLLFTIDEKTNSVDLTEKGLEALTGASEDPSFFVMPDISVELEKIDRSASLSDHEKVEKKDQVLTDYNIKSQRIHIVSQLLKAYTMFEKDVDYVIMDGKVKIVDEQTGRIMEGRRYSDGLHQALEAKENVRVEEATQTYATITLQNYFRMYHKLAGMTGTAETEAGEFWEIYKLDVVVIPTNRPISRDDRDDLVYKTVREKYNAVVEEVKKMIDQGRPVLVGTTSVENSEILSRMLRLRGIQHQVLNAKQHAKEAEVVALAGLPRTVTIATNMAGRGTDIKLTPESKQAGGLAIIGTERHESRRVDRQLRGRAGRQGDVGSSQFFVSLEDNLMRLFGSDKLSRFMDRFGGYEEGEAIQHSMVTSSIERAQKKVEENNFSIRKRLLEYDDVMNSQRSVIYKRRNNALEGERLELDIMQSFDQVALSIANNTKGDYKGFELSVFQNFGIDAPVAADQFARGNDEEIAYKVSDVAYKHFKGRMFDMAEKAIMGTISGLYEDNKAHAHEIMLRVPFTDGRRVLTIPVNLQRTYETRGRDVIKQMQQAVFLMFLDHTWKEHLRDMDDLRQQVQHASYEQKDPLLIYKFEAFKMFSTFLDKLNGDIVNFFAKAAVLTEDPDQLRKASQEMQRRMAAQAAAAEQAKVVAQKAEAQAAQTGNTQEQLAKLIESLPPQEREKPQPLRTAKTWGRNDKVSVRYLDGTVKKDVKFKTVENDVLANLCIVLED